MAYVVPEAILLPNSIAADMLGPKMANIDLFGCFWGANAANTYKNTIVLAL